MTYIKNNQFNRIEGLDIIRTVAILCVLFLHGVPPDFQEIEYVNNLSGFSRLFHFFCFSIGRQSVPLFLCLSGYLLLSRDYNEEQTRKFYRYNFLSLLLTWEAWIPIYNWAMSWYNDIPLNWSMILKNMLFLESTNIFHGWYMEVILGIYLFIPYLSRVLHTMNYREILPLMLISYLFFFIVPTMYHLKANPAQWNSCLDLSFSGGMYAFYLILGFIIKQYDRQITLSIKKWSIPVILISITATTEVQMWASLKQVYHIWYDFCLLPISSIFIFIYLKDLKCQILHNLITKISTCAFGIYLTHVLLVIFILKYHLLNFIVVDELRVIIFALIMFVLSFILVILLKKLPYVGKILVR